jgi:hypothetical protein
MILVLAFIACAGNYCRTVELPWDGSLLQCQLFGQQAVAAYAEPRNLTVPRGWRCGPQEKQA